MVPRPPRRRNTPCSLSVRESNISTRCDFRLGYTGRRERVEDAAQRVAFEVGRDEWFVAVTEVAPKRFRGGVAEDLVHLVDSNRPFDVGDEVADGNGSRGHPEGHAVEAALELWDDERYSLRRAGSGRDDVDAGRAGAA